MVTAIGVYLYTSNKTEEEEIAVADDMDELIDNIEIIREDNGTLAFESFIEIFKISAKQAKR